jgi:hypothetical protein
VEEKGNTGTAVRKVVREAEAKSSDSIPTPGNILSHRNGKKQEKKELLLPFLLFGMVSSKKRLREI